MGLVARVKSLGAVAGKEIAIELKSGNTLKNGNTIFLCSARVYGRFINDYILAL